MIQVYNIDKLKDLRIYRGKIRLFSDGNDKRKNTLLLLNTNTIDDSIKVLNNENIDRRIFFSYYTPYKETITITGKKVERYNQQEIYKEIKDKTKLIRVTRKELKDYKNDNLIYDVNYLNSSIFNSYSAIPVRKKSQIYMTNFLNIFSKPELQGYNKIYMVFPLDTAYNSVTQELIKPDVLNNPLSVLFNLAIYNPMELKKLPNITCIMASSVNNIFIRFNPSTLTKVELSRLSKLIDINSKLIRKEKLSEGEIELLNQTKFELHDDVSTSTKDKISNNLKGTVKSNFNIEGLTGSKQSKELMDAIDNVIESEVEKTGNVSEDNVKEKTKQIADNLEGNEEFKDYVNQLKDEQLKAKKASNMTKRDQLLRENQAKLKVQGDTTLEEILTEYNDKKIDRRKVENDSLAYDYAKSSTIVDFEKSYNEKQLLKDQMMVLECFSSMDKDIQLYIKSIEREDTSDEFTFKETLTVVFEDSKRVRHTVKIDIPKIVDDRFLYINGNKKGIIKQLFLKPVVKTGRDEVQVVSNYNKAFINRYGQNVSPKLNRLKKLLLENKISGVSVKAGNCQLANTEYLTNIEYDDLSTNVQSIEIGNDVMISFNQQVIRSYLVDHKIDIDKLQPNQIPIGINKKTVLVLNIDSNIVEGTNKELSDYILDLLKKQDPKVLDIIKDIKVGKRYMYSRASVLSKKIPLAVFLAYKDGLTTLLRKAGIKHEFTDKRRNLSVDEKNNKGVIQFADGYLIYDMYPYRNSLLMNGFLEVDTKLYPYEYFDSKEVYLDVFNNLFGTRTIGKGLDNFFQLFLDPITLEVLNDLDMPTDFVELFLYANSLLEDNMFNRESDMSNYRIRSNEIIAVYLYNILAKSYATYKDTANASNPIKVSVPQDKLIKELLGSVLVEDNNILNPVIEGTVNCTYKGPSGLNLQEAYNLEKRAYSQSMVGLLAASSPYNSSVGVTREVSWNANINSVRGYMTPGSKENIEDINYSSIGTTAELVTTFAVNHDDPPRVAMNSTQTRHGVPLENADALLVGSGMEKTLVNFLGSEFVFNAEQDGVVEEYDEKTDIMVVKYKDGSKKAYDCSDKLSKNGGGGFYISNTKEVHFKKGQKFKKGDILVSNPDFFSGNDLLVGKLVKIGVFGGYYTYEDSILISDSLSDKMATKVTMEKQLKLGPNSNVSFLVKKGDKVKVGEPLAIFEESFDEKEANIFLSKLGDEYKEDILAQGRNTVPSKYTGEIADVEVYYTVPFEELSPSLQGIVKNINKETQAKKAVIKKHFKDIKDTNMVFKPTEQIVTKDGKVRGIEVGEGVVIRIYIRYRDRLETGDKITFFSALKGIIQQTIPAELAPYSDVGGEDEIIEAVLAPGALQGRMVTSAILNLYINKVLIELKNTIASEYGIKRRVL